MYASPVANLPCVYVAVAVYTQCLYTSVAFYTTVRVSIFFSIFTCFLFRLVPVLFFSEGGGGGGSAWGVLLARWQDCVIRVLLDWDGEIHYRRCWLSDWARWHDTHANIAVKECLALAADG